METNKEPGDIMKQIKTLKDTNRGLISDWEKDTFDKKLFYINASGLVCPLPDDPKSREGRRADFLDHFQNEFNEGNNY